MVTYGEQVRMLQEFYAAHDPSKDEQGIVAIVDKRKGQRPELSPAQWKMICAQLKKKYGHAVYPEGPGGPSTCEEVTAIPASSASATLMTPQQTPPAHAVAVEAGAESESLQPTGQPADGENHPSAAVGAIVPATQCADTAIGQDSTTDVVPAPQQVADTTTSKPSAAGPDPFQDQIRALAAFYAEHDRSKDQRSVVAILDKRRGANSALTSDQWTALGMQLEKKYGHPLGPGEPSDSWSEVETDTDLDTSSTTEIVAAEDERVQELAQFAPEVLATMVVEREMQIAQLREKAKQKVRELLRQKVGAVKALDGRSAKVTALESQVREVSRRAEVRQKRIDQLQAANQKQKVELEALRQESGVAHAQEMQRVADLERQVQDLSTEAETDAAEEAARTMSRQRELEGTRQEQAALQVEMMELAAALASAERSQSAWQSKAREAQEQLEELRRATAVARSEEGAPQAATSVAPASVQLQQPVAEGGLDDMQCAIVEARVLRER